MVRFLVVLSLALSFLVLATTASADPIEVVLSSKIVSIKDSKTMNQYILKGNKARVYSKVAIHAKGYANRGLRQWLEKRLPRQLAGYYEREDKDTGLSTRYRPVPFQLRRDQVFCTAGNSPEFEVCHADFAVSTANAVDIPSGEGGEHAVTLQMLPPEGDFRVRMAKSQTKSYVVLSGDPKLSKYSFAGMPEN